MHTVHNEQYQLTVSSTYLFFCRCSSTLLSRPDCFFSCSLVTQGNKPGKFIHSSLLDGPSVFSVNTFPHFFYRFITTLLTSTNGTVKTRVLEQRRVWAHILNVTVLSMYISILRSLSYISALTMRVVIAAKV